MLRHVTFAAVGCVILLLVGGQSVLASDLAGRLRVGGSVGMGMCEQDDLNDTIDDQEDFYTLWEIDWDDSELSGALQVGAYAEYLINDNWIVGAEFLRLSSSGGYDWYDDSFGTTDVDSDYDAAGNLASVYGAYRFALGDSPVTLRLGAGVGYLFGVTFELDYDAYQVLDLGPDDDDTLAYQTDLKATGSTVAFHGLIGAEYQLTDSLLLSANVAYRVGSINELEVDEFSATVNGAPNDFWDIERGEILRWYNDEIDDDEWTTSFSTREGDRVGLDFGGLYFTLSVAYLF